MFDEPAHSSSMTRQIFDSFFVVFVFQTLVLLIPQFLWKPKVCSTETWFGSIGLNSGKVSLKVMLFILTSECSHIIDITGRSEDRKKTLMASTAADDAVGLTGNERKTTYILWETENREWVNDT